MFVCGLCFTARAEGPETQDGNEIELSIDRGKSGGVDIPLPRTPIKMPKAWICNHTLLICGIGGEYTVRLYDEDGELVYFIPVWGATGCDTILLPSMLSGDYEVSIFVGSFCFSGFINL